MRQSNPFGWVHQIVFSPIFWGVGATALFYVCLCGGVIRVQTVLHYFLSPEEHEILSIPFVEILMFFIGFFAIGFKCRDVRFQSRWVAKQEASPETFFSVPEAGHFQPSDAAGMIARLEEIPEKVRNGYFIQRLKASLDYVLRNQSARGFSDEMKYLSDMDAGRMAQSYAFIRVIIWAIPILGFLGTVMGITLAIGGLGGNLSDTEQTLPKMIADLSYAFDTTALALSFSIVLMFFQFYVEKLEHRLLDRVDEQTNRELAGRFEEFSNSPEGIVQAVRAHGEVVCGMMEKQAKRQCALWEESFRNVETGWTRRLESVGSVMADSVQRAFESAALKLATKTGDSIGEKISMEFSRQFQSSVTGQWVSYATEIKDAEKQLTEQSALLKDAMKQNADFFSQSNLAMTQGARKFMELADAVENSAARLESVSSSVSAISEAARQMAESGEKISKMENVLGQNLSTLKGARDFERTVAQLATTVTALNELLNEIKSARK